MPKNNDLSWATYLLGAFIGFILGAFGTAFTCGLDLESQKEKHAACSEFINADACECWVKNRCGSDSGRASAREGLIEKGKQR